MADTINLTKRAKEIIESINYLTLATVTPEGNPWNSPVFQVRDKSLNFYWFSDKEGQHSKNVRANGRAFGVIYDSTVLEGNGEGVYLDFTVSELSDPAEIEAVRKIKKGSEYISTPGEFLDDAVRRVYKAVPTRIWMNTDDRENGIFLRDLRIELPIEEMRVV